MKLILVLQGIILVLVAGQQLYSHRLGERKLVAL